MIESTRPETYELPKRIQRSVLVSSSLCGGGYTQNILAQCPLIYMIVLGEWISTLFGNRLKHYNYIIVINETHLLINYLLRQNTETCVRHRDVGPALGRLGLENI